MKIKVTVSLPHDDIQWFKENYSEEGQLSWVLTMLLHNFRSIHHDTGVSPIKVARDAAKEVKTLIDEVG